MPQVFLGRKLHHNFPVKWKLKLTNRQTEPQSQKLCSKVSFIAYFRWKLLEAFKPISGLFQQSDTSHLSKPLVLLACTSPERSTYRQGSPRHLDCKLVAWLRPHIPVTEEKLIFKKCVRAHTRIKYHSFFHDFTMYR